MDTDRFGTRAEGCARARNPLRTLLLVGAVSLAAGCADGRSEARTHSVAIRNFQYVPATATVAVGDTIVWTNEDVVPHTATATDRAWDTGSIAGRETGRVVVERKGKHEYLCAFHPNMKAELTAE
jgi:plastocyanin